MNAPLSLCEREQAHMVLDGVAEQLAFLETHVATCRLYCGINDLAGLSYSLNAGKAHMRAALELNVDLRRLTNGLAALPPQPKKQEPSPRRARRRVIDV